LRRRLFFFQERGEVGQPLGPEPFVAVEPFEGVPHWLGVEPAGDDAPGLGARDETGIGQYAKMLHHRRQRHRKRRGELAHRKIGLLGKPHYQRAARRVGKRGKGAVERDV
jgi:hypothetical protein